MEIFPVDKNTQTNMKMHQYKSANWRIKIRKTLKIRGRAILLKHKKKCIFLNDSKMNKHEE